MQERFRSDISRAKGLGSAHDGVHHWLAQRFSSVLLTVLIVWVLFIISCVVGKETNEVMEVIRRPGNVLGISLFTIAIFYHANLGMQVIIEDYCNCRALRIFFLYGVKMLSIVTAMAVIVAMFYLMAI